MSDPKTMFLTNDPLTRKKWSKELFSVILPNMEFNDLIGTGTDSIVQMKTELAKGEGDRLKMGIRLPLIGEGIVGNDTVEGNEEGLRFRDFSFTIEELNHAVDTGGKMNEQRIPYNLMQEGKNGLQDWWSTKLSQYLINMLAGNSSFRVAGKVFADTFVEPDTNHLLVVGDKTEATVTSAETMDLNFLDRMKQRAEVPSISALNADNTPTGTVVPVRPLKKGGKPYYHVLLHNFVFDALRQNTNIGQWGDLQRAAGKLGIPNVEIEYNGMLIRKTQRLPRVAGTAADGAGAYRALLLGAQAGCFGWGGAGESKSTVMSFTPYTKDAERFVMVRGGGIFGGAKTRFDGSDYGVICGTSWGNPLSA